VYFIIKGKRDSLPTDPKARRAAVQAWEEAESLSLREAAKRRRDHIRHHRLAEAAERLDIVEQDIESARAVRRSMERRING